MTKNAPTYPLPLPVTEAEAWQTLGEQLEMYPSKAFASGLCWSADRVFGYGGEITMVESGYEPAYPDNPRACLRAEMYTRAYRHVKMLNSHRSMAYDSPELDARILAAYWMALEAADEASAKP